MLADFCSISHGVARAKVYGYIIKWQTGQAGLRYSKLAGQIVSYVTHNSIAVSNLKRNKKK